MKIANYFASAVFVFGAIVQLNDPDPLAWMTTYLAAAVACIVHIRAPRFVWLAAALVLLCIGWALKLAPNVMGHIPFLSMFSAWEMKNVGIEQSREMYGLLIIGLWMSVLTVRSFRLRHSTRPS